MSYGALPKLHYYVIGLPAHSGPGRGGVHADPGGAELHLVESQTLAPGFRPDAGDILAIQVQLGEIDLGDRWVGPQPFQGCFSGSRIAYLVTLRSQSRSHHATDLRVIVYYKSIRPVFILASVTKSEGPATGHSRTV